TVVQWIWTTCLKPKKTRSRARMIAHWVDVASAACRVRHYSVLLMVMMALSNNLLSRLKATWAELSPEHRAAFRDLCALCSPEKNYSRLRELAKHHQVALPMAVLTKDIIISLEATGYSCRITPRRDAVPYYALLSIGLLIIDSHSLYRHLAHAPSDLNPDLLHFFSNPVPRLVTDKLYALSYKHEPLKQTDALAHQPQASLETTHNPLHASRSIVGLTHVVL
ncbi:MAG: RasGEF domain-containing protein, partial [archaeon]|nr:RasGEF domain-containing protein [archaeon]